MTCNITFWRADWVGDCEVFNTIHPKPQLRCVAPRHAAPRYARQTRHDLRQVPRTTTITSTNSAMLQCESSRQDPATPEDVDTPVYTTRPTGIDINVHQ